MPNTLGDIEERENREDESYSAAIDDRSEREQIALEEDGDVPEEDDGWPPEPSDDDPNLREEREEDVEDADTEPCTSRFGYGGGPRHRN